MAALPGRRSAMTLGRLLLVGLAIGVMVLAAAHSTARRRAQAKREVTVERILAVREALEKYAIDNAGKFPPTDPGLLLLVEPPPKKLRRRVIRWKGPYLPSREYLYDGWGRPFHYCRGGRGDPPHPYELWSYGRDGRDDGAKWHDDIDVWKPDTLTP